MRINKFLAYIGIASRRKIDELIEKGMVKINNRVAKLGDQVDSQKDTVEVDGKKVGDRKQNFVYIALNKPKGYVSTTAVFKGEKSVLELLPSHPELDSGSRFRIKSGMTRDSFPRLYPVGRLDKDSSGLILLTNDGQLTQKITHPKYHLPKTYQVTVLGNVGQEQLSQLRSPVKLEEGTTQKAEVKIISQSLPHHSIFEMTLFEGKKRQIRRMTAYLHLHILDLKRISIGPVKLGSLGLGKYRNLTSEEVKQLTSRQ